MDTVLTDLRFALRQIRRHPGFAVTAAVSLAIGVGVFDALPGFQDAGLGHPIVFVHREASGGQRGRHGRSSGRCVCRIPRRSGFRTVIAAVGRFHGHAGNLSRARGARERPGRSGEVSAR